MTDYLTTMPPSHLGLRSIQEMVASLKGKLDIVSHPKKETKVTITISCRRDMRRIKENKLGKDHGIQELLFEGGTLLNR